MQARREKITRRGNLRKSHLQPLGFSILAQTLGEISPDQQTKMQLILRIEFPGSEFVEYIFDTKEIEEIKARIATFTHLDGVIRRQNADQELAKDQPNLPPGKPTPT